DEQDGVLDRIEEPRFAVGERGELGVELQACAPYALDQGAEILAVGARHVLRLAELLQQLLPRAGIELPAIQRLQRQLARDGARAMVLAGRRCAHRRAPLTGAPSGRPSRARTASPRRPCFRPWSRPVPAPARASSPAARRRRSARRSRGWRAAV